MLEYSKEFLEKNIDFFTKKDVKNLWELINHHSDLYYNKEKPIISDFEYDILFKKLEILEKKFNLKHKQSLKVWSKLTESSFEKIKHSRPMISLDNTYNEEDLKKFEQRVKKNIVAASSNSDLEEGILENIEYALEFKFDWLWVELIYKHWKLIQAITRWNWIEWEDVTENIMQIENIPKNIDYKNDLEVRGEVVMPISSFEMLNKKAKINWGKIFSNPRNAASWSLRMKDNRITKERKLQFFAYDLSNFEEFRKKERKESYFDIIKDLKNLNFSISSYFEISKNIWEVIKKIQNFWDIKQKIDFEIDGLVIKVNNIKFWQKIGFTEHHPKYAISYKFPGLIFTTKILNIEHQIWKTWTITPVANLEAVNMWWAIIKRATLHNYEEVEKLWIKIWDIVFIKRAWEVIPKIISVSVASNFEKITPPQKCPSCNSEIKKDENKVRYFCDNKKCSAQVTQKLIYAIGKQWFNIDGFWEKQIRKFFKLWFIKNLSNIFELKNFKQQILELDWFQEKSVNKILENIEKSKKVDISIFLNSLSISWIGKKTSKTISQLFLSKQDLINFKYWLEEIENLADIWPEISQNLITFFNDLENKQILKKLSNILEIKFFEMKNFNKNNFFTWKKVCITWSFEKDWKKISRDQLIKILEENWWLFINSISKNTDFLVAWEKAGSKLEKAKKLSIEILNLENFLNLSK